MINYPVDVENTKWAIVRISDNTILKHKIKWPRIDGTPPIGLDPDITFLLEVVEAQPVYDPLTQYIELDQEGIIDIDANTHTHSWTIKSLSQESIDDNTEREQAKAMYLDLKNGVGTSAERLIRTEKVCAYLLKALFGAQ